MWTDPGSLRDWTDHNLDAYWRVWWQRSSHLASKAGMACLTTWGRRGECLVSAGCITRRPQARSPQRTPPANTAARRLAPNGGRINIDECYASGAAALRGRIFRSVFARRRDALDFVDMAITDAHRIA